MLGYSPKPIHAAAFVLACMLCIAAQGYAKNQQVVLALKIGAWIFGFLIFVITGIIALEAVNNRARVMVDFAHEIGRLDEEARAMLAFEFPSLRYKMKAGQVREYFEDTDVTIEQFRSFLATSSSKYISPVRDWNTAQQPRWAHEEIRAWLEGKGYILEDSYAGNHSWMWRGNSYNHLMAYWMAGRKPENLNIGTEAMKGTVE